MMGITLTIEEEAIIAIPPKNMRINFPIIYTKPVLIFL